MPILARSSGGGDGDLSALERRMGWGGPWASIAADYSTGLILCVQADNAQTALEDLAPSPAAWSTNNMVSTPIPNLADTTRQAADNGWLRSTGTKTTASAKQILLGTGAVCALIDVQHGGTLGFTAGNQWFVLDMPGVGDPGSALLALIPLSFNAGTNVLTLRLFAEQTGGANLTADFPVDLDTFYGPMAVFIQRSDNGDGTISHQVWVNDSTTPVTFSAVGGVSAAGSGTTTATFADAAEGGATADLEIGGAGFDHPLHGFALWSTNQSANRAAVMALFGCG